MQTENNKRAIIYARVSTGEQAEHGTSLAEQLEACRDKAAAIGAVVVGVYEDAGVSGALYKGRPGLQAALYDLELHQATCLIITKLDRCSRDREHQSAIKKRVEAAGARLLFCDMDFDKSATGDFAFGLVGSFAEYERTIIKERTMNGRRRRAQEGIQPSRNHSPYGYHVVSNKDVASGLYPPETLGKYQVVDEKAKLVKEIFARVAGGQSIQSVARWLSDSGVPTPRGAVFWNWGSLQRLLQHPVYKGQAAFGRFERRHDEGRIKQGYKTTYKLVERPKEQWVCIEAPVLVDEETWDAVQQRIKTNRSEKSGRIDRKHMLSGLMRCPRCKEKMRAGRRRHSPKNENSEFYNFYECRYSRPSTNGGGKVCSNKQYRGYGIEPLVISAIQELTKRPEMMLAAVKAYRKAQANQASQPDIDYLQRQLADLHQRERATIEAQISGIMAGADISIYESILREIAGKCAHINNLLTRAGHQGDKKTKLKDEAAIVTQAIAAVDRVLNAPDNCLTPGEKYGLLSKVIEAIHPESDAGLKIILKPAFASLNQSVAYFTT